MSRLLVSIVVILVVVVGALFLLGGIVDQAGRVQAELDEII